MATVNNSSINTGLFAPTTFIWQINQIARSEVNQDLQSILVSLYQNIGYVATVANLKESGYYIPQEFVTSKLFFPNPAATDPSLALQYRMGYRLLVDFGALPNTGTKAVAHGLTINHGYQFTDIYAVANDTVSFQYLPIPYASVIGDNIEISVDATNVTIATLSDRTNFNKCYVILEYIKT